MLSTPQKNFPALSAEKKSGPPHCVGSAPVKLPNRGLLCVVESDTKRALQPKWYPIKFLPNMEKLHPKRKKNTQKSKQFLLFLHGMSIQTWQLALCKFLVFQSMGRIGTLTSSRVALNQGDKIAKWIQIHFQYEIKLINKQIGHPLFFVILGTRHQQWQNQPFISVKNTSSNFSVEGPRWEPTNPYWNCPAMSKIYGFQRWGNHQQEKVTCLFWYNDDRELMPIFW